MKITPTDIAVLAIIVVTAIAIVVIYKPFDFQRRDKSDKEE